MRQPNPDDFLLLPENITMEPLGAYIRKGDDGWLDVVRWTQFALVWAEQLGVTAATVDKQADSASGASSDVRRLLGLEGDVGPSMGLDRRWAANAVKAVGNYGEMWQRNIGPFGLARGLNNLVGQGWPHVLAATALSRRLKPAPSPPSRADPPLPAKPPADTGTPVS